MHDGTARDGPFEQTRISESVGCAEFGVADERDVVHRHHDRRARRRCDEVRGVHDIDGAGPVLDAWAGRATIPEFSNHACRYRSGGGSNCGGHGGAQLVPSAPGQGKRVDGDIGSTVQAVEYACGDLSDTGTVAEQRGAVERDSEAVDPAMLPADTSAAR